MGLISLGIGSPASLALLVLFGLSPHPGGSTGPAYHTSDLTTDVAFYLPTLLPGEQSDQFRTYANSVRSLDDDTNTGMWLDLNF